MPKRLSAWLVIYEFVWILTFVLSGLATLLLGRAHSLESIDFIKSHNLLSAVTSIWLSNVSSFLVGGVLIIIHPLLGVLAVLFTSLASGDLLASWLAGYCHTAHFIYGNIETQVYILLWLLIVRVYFKQRTCKDLMCRWVSTVSYVKRILVAVLTCFLILSIIEVAEVLAYG